MSERIYVVRTWIGPGQFVRDEHRESELRDSDRRLLLGQLIESWNNTPTNEQNQFLSMVVAEMTAQRNHESILNMIQTATAEEIDRAVGELYRENMASNDQED